MKRAVTFILISSILLSVFYIPFTSVAYEALPEVDTYINLEQKEDSIYVSLYMTPHSDMNVAGMSFQIRYAYSYGVGQYPFSYNEKDDDLLLDERFSDALIANDITEEGSINYAWNSITSVSIPAGEEILLAKIPLIIDEAANDGEYAFTLICRNFYCSETNEESGVEELIDINVDVPENDTIIWFGEKLKTDYNEYEVVVSGTTNIPLMIHVNKNVNSSSCYIDDSSVAKILKVENATDGSDADIYIIGKSAGSTTLVIYGGYNDYEQTSVTIHVSDAIPYFLDVSKMPSKTTYEIGETLDLAGLELQVIYDNYDVEYITSGFIADTYDFSTTGNKQIKVLYKDMYAYVTVTVIDSSTPTDVMRGDVNGNGEVTDADAVHLLYYTFFPEDYPVNQDCDFNGDSAVTDADAVYLLYYTFFPEDYPLE